VPKHGAGPDQELTWLTARGSNWTRPEPALEHDNPYFAVERYDTAAPTGTAATYWVQRCKSIAACVVPLHADGTITLVGQWRFPLNAYSWELPKGGVFVGENVLAGAKRELLEETGLIARNWRRLLCLDLMNASSDKAAEVFLATDLTQGEVAPDPTESLSIIRVPLDEALHAAVNGKIRDAVTVTALLQMKLISLDAARRPDDQGAGALQG